MRVLKELSDVAATLELNIYKKLRETDPEAKNPGDPGFFIRKGVYDASEIAVPDGWQVLGASFATTFVSHFHDPATPAVVSAVRFH